MTEIVIKQDAYDLGIRNPVGCLITGLDVRSDAPQLDEEVGEIERSIKRDLDEALSSDVIESARDLYTNMGYPDQTPDGEKRMQLIGKRGLNRHNNVVDAYNITGAEYGIGLGMHDVAQLDGNVVIQCATGGERMVPLFRESYRKAQEGDLIYGTDQHTLWIAGRLGRDSDEFKVTKDTEQALLMAIGNAETSEGFNRDVCSRAFELIRKTCPDASLEFLPITTEEQAVPTP